MRMIPNTTQVPNIIIDRYMKHLTGTEFRILLIIVRKTLGWIQDTETGARKSEDWISRTQLQEFSGAHTQAVSSAIQKLQNLGLIEIRDQKANLLSSPEERRGKRLFYRLSTNMFDNQTTPSRHNMFDNQSLKIKHTKETNTKDISKDISGVKKTPACPLLNGSPLKSKYPNGHRECVEYIESFKFVNKPKQYQFLHKMLRAGCDFPDLDRIIHKIEKNPFYQENGFDMATVAGEMDRRSNART